MSFLLWHQQGAARIASPRRVLRAHEVPLLQDAQLLRDRLQALHEGESARQEASFADARSQGYEEGLAQGRRDAAEEQARQLLALAEASAARHASLQADIAALALQVVRKLAAQMPVDEWLLSLADTAARDLIDEGPVTLVLHPDDEAVVRARLAQSAAAAGAVVGSDACAASGASTVPAAPDSSTTRSFGDALLQQRAWQLPNGLPITLHSDPQCPPGSCRLETPQGSVDASLQTQLARLEQAWGVASG